jgi:endonuclease G
MQFPIALLAATLLLACSAPSTETTAVATTPHSATQVLSFVEGFESGTKTAYETAPVTLVTGPWLFTESLIGGSDSDNRRGLHAARLRAGGKLTMLFDAPAGTRKITVTAATYGHDTPSTWELWLSRDHGRTWQRNGQPQVTKQAIPQIFTFQGSANEPLRLEIRKTDSSKSRLNLDDIALEGVTTDYSKVTVTPSPAPTTPAPTTPTKPQPQLPTSTRSDNDNLLLGNPSGATSDPTNVTNYLLIHPQYATGYNATRGIPVWTSWHVGRPDLTKAAPRQDDFRADPALPRQFYAVAPQSYSGSGFDKGHNCPSGDRTASLDDNSATFLMSNMVPQAPQNNQQTWGNLEEYTRSQVVKGQEAYVIMGSYGRGGVGKNGPASTIDQGRVTVPARIWKVIVFLPEGSGDLKRIVGGQARIVAIDTPNDNSISPNWNQYLTSVDKIEAASGLDILSALPVATQTQLQKLVDSGSGR